MSGGTPQSPREGGKTPERPWNRERPRTLVIACSDGRLQEDVDGFLEQDFGIVHYDRLYIPGGPGALASSGIEVHRSYAHISECRFLVASHRIETILWIFHGPAADGPDEALCVDYLRKLPGRTVAQIRRQQEDDAAELLKLSLGGPVRAEAYRCEVTGAGSVRIVRLGEGTL